MKSDKKEGKVEGRWKKRKNCGKEKDTVFM